MSLNFNMKLIVFLIIFSTFLSGPQSGPTQQDKARLAELMNDDSFTMVDREVTEWLSAINKPKQKIYDAYLTKSLAIVKVRFRQRAGWEGQYTIVWCTVAAGKVEIVEAYFGDESGSGELKYIRQHQPEEIRLGQFLDSRKCVPFEPKREKSSIELCVSYKVEKDSKWKAF